MVAVATLALAGVAGCTGTAPREIDEAAVNALYVSMDAAVGRYQAGLHAMRDGDLDAARGLMASATEELVSGATACAAMAGCETPRFMAAYDTLLSLRSDVLTGAADGLIADVPANEGTSPMLSQLPEAGRSMNLLNGRELANLIEVNGPVKAALHDWLTWMRPQLIDSYENYQVMRHLMWPAYEEAGLPEALLFGILAKESGGRVHATSHAGAAGPFQFMYHTGLRFGLGRENGFDKRFDPAAAARANVAYLNEQFRVLNNDLELVLAAYNGGEGRMRRLYDRSRGKRFWSADIIGQLPRETQEYVPYVLAAAWLFLHPGEHGVEFPSIDSAPGEVRLANPMTLSELAICIGQAGSRNGWFRALRNLNPSMDPNARLAADTRVFIPAGLVGAYEAQCREGPRVDLAAALQAARQPGGVARASGRPYVVKKGDTLASISRRFRCEGPEAIARANRIAAPRYLIRPQQELLLVGCAG
ncbi:MAG: transglycosylase SLT domain-containing protein [Pseudomonadales bacterium]|nr:transglycosylase SLT domain-containing protein [Pseudomonadales bacterium]